jgi:GT2 family glycosyltransferase
MLVRADVAEATHGFDESFHMYCEEIDWSWRIQAAGWRIYAVPSAEIVHYGGESTRQVPATSVVNLWQSRAKLYGEMYGRFKLFIARKMVQLAMRRRAKKATDPQMKQAYETIIQIWRGI